MKLTMVSGDIEIIEMIQKSTQLNNLPLAIITAETDPLDLVAEIIASRPNLLIVDDDLVQPHSTRVLKAVSHMTQNITFIFLTSTASMELGREISPLGISFYGIKPLDPQELEQAIHSIINDKTQNLLKV